MVSVSGNLVGCSGPKKRKYCKIRTRRSGKESCGWTYSRQYGVNISIHQGVSTTEEDKTTSRVISPFDIR